MISVWRSLTTKMDTRIFFRIPLQFILSVRHRSDSQIYSANFQREFITNELPDHLSEFLLHTKIKGKAKSNQSKGRSFVPFDKFQTFVRHYPEKGVLVDESTGENIAQSIVKHTRCEGNSSFFDGEGGFGYIAKHVAREKKFEKVTVLEKDMNLHEFHSFSKKHIQDNAHDVKFHDEEMNFNQIACNGLNHGFNYVSPMRSLVSGGTKWEDSLPPYTLVTTATQGFIKYLTLRCLHRNQFSEFYRTRPELFFLTTARTYFHMCCGTDDLVLPTHKLSEDEMNKKIESISTISLLLLPMNVLFRAMFDFYLVDLVDRRSFLPWRPHRPYNKVKRKTETKGIDNLYMDLHDKLLLIYVRPKLKPLMDTSNPFHVEFYLSYLLQRRKVPVVPILEGWMPGAGLFLVQRGRNIFSQVGDLSVHELFEVYNYISGHQDFAVSNFAAEAETFKKYELDSRQDKMEKRQERAEEIRMLLRRTVSKKNSKESLNS